ncbi:MAG: type II secretion system protein GspI, partial [Proteobacteria bacterium]|nr:type II secretion system protein GspI [Pseudomonadota bacterium]
EGCTAHQGDAVRLLETVAGGFMAAGRQALTQMQRLEDKTMAGWVAENTMAELRAARSWPEVGTRSQRVTLAGRSWDVRIAVLQSPHPDMRKLDVSVAAEGGDSLLTLSGFLGRH